MSRLYKGISPGRISEARVSVASQPASMHNSRHPTGSLLVESRPRRSRTQKCPVAPRKISRLATVGRLSLALASLLGSVTSAAADNGKPSVRAVEADDFFQVRPELVELGQVLFFDKELSGNRNIACSTCHSPLAGTSDGLSTNLGEGAQGFSVSRDPGKFPPAPSDPLDRGARNAPGLFNLSANEYIAMMHDGRFMVEPSHPSGFVTPADLDLPVGFDHLLEVISIFAFTDGQEMLGQPGENEVADAAVNSPFTGVWSLLANRIKAIPEYRAMFVTAFPELNGDADNLTMLHVGKAIGHFQAAAYQGALDAPFDRFMRGDKKAISKQAARGFKLFNQKAGCVDCHNGPFLTDQSFHAIAMPQIGPGFNGVGFEGRDDFGREGVTGNPADRYKFRTPTLRNVALTGPWGHDGAYSTLEAVVDHHLNGNQALYSYDAAQRVLPPRDDLDSFDLRVTGHPPTLQNLAARNELAPVVLTTNERAALIAFLHALTDPSSIDLRHTTPKRIPSGATLAD